MKSSTSPRPRITSMPGLPRTTGRSTPKLTLNLGLRYDVSLPRTERHNRQNWFDPNVVTPLNGGTITYQDPLTLGIDAPVAWRRSVCQLPRAHQLCDGLERHSAAFRLRLPVHSEDGVARRLRHLLRPDPLWRQRRVCPTARRDSTRYTNVITTYQNDRATPYLHLSNPFPNGLDQPAGSSLGLMNDVGF